MLSLLMLVMRMLLTLADVSDIAVGCRCRPSSSSLLSHVIISISLRAGATRS
jgi:hypothetical protein